MFVLWVPIWVVFLQRKRRIRIRHGDVPHPRRCALAVVPPGIRALELVVGVRERSGLRARFARDRIARGRGARDDRHHAELHAVRRRRSRRERAAADDERAAAHRRRGRGPSRLLEQPSHRHRHRGAPSDRARTADPQRDDRGSSARRLLRAPAAVRAVCRPSARVTWRNRRRRSAHQRRSVVGRAQDPGPFRPHERRHRGRRGAACRERRARPLSLDPNDRSHAGGCPRSCALRTANDGASQRPDSQRATRDDPVS